MTATLQDMALILAFILIGGVFAAAEMSLVSLRESQLKQLALRGKRGAKVAELAESPNRFLSAGQIGVTLSGFLSAAFGGATLSERLAPVLIGWGVPASIATMLALVFITIVISYFSIVLGELAAKRLAMQRAEAFAMALAPMVDAIAKAARPLIWFLGVSTNAVVRLLGGDPNAGREAVSEQELRALVTGSHSLGAEERRIVDELFDAGERSLREVMVPRTEVDFLPGTMAAHTAIREVQGAPHSRYPVTGQTVDDVLGFLHVRDLMDLDPATRNTPVARLVRPVTSLPETVKILHAHLAPLAGAGDGVRIEAAQMVHRAGVALVVQHGLQAGGQLARLAGGRAVVVAAYGLAVLVTHKQQLLFTLALALQLPVVHHGHQGDAAQGQAQQQPQQQHAARFHGGPPAPGGASAAGVLSGCARASGWGPGASGCTGLGATS